MIEKIASPVAKITKIGNTSKETRNEAYDISTAANKARISFNKAFATKISVTKRENARIMSLVIPVKEKIITYMMQIKNPTIKDHFIWELFFASSLRVMVLY